MTTIIIRHGEAIGNKEGRFLGRIDPPLTEGGRVSAGLIAKALARHPAEHIISSDLARAYETASIIAKHLNLKVKVDVRLREIDHGAIDGWLADEIDHSPFGKLRQRDKYDFRAPRGESYHDIEPRIRKIILAVQDLNTILVTHLGPMRVAMRVFGGISPTKAAALDIDHSTPIYVEAEGERLVAKLGNPLI